MGPRATSIISIFFYVISCKCVFSPVDLTFGSVYFLFADYMSFPFTLMRGSNYDWFDDVVVIL